MRTIAFQTQRGGSGKTTTAVHLAHLLSLQKYKVLLIDTDPQGTLKTLLKLSHHSTLYDILISDFKLDEVIIREVRPNLDVIISDKTLFQAERIMVTMPRREDLLKRQLRDLESKYDFILLDCPPSLSEIVQAVYFYASEIIIPIAMDYMSLIGCQQVLETLKLLKKDFDLNIQVTGIIPVAVDPRLTITELILNSIQTQYAPYYPIFPKVRTDAGISKASARGQTLYDRITVPLEKLTEEHRAAWDYLQVCNHLLKPKSEKKIASVSVRKKINEVVT